MGGLSDGGRSRVTRNPVREKPLVVNVHVHGEEPPATLHGLAGGCCSSLCPGRWPALRSPARPCC